MTGALKEITLYIDTDGDGTMESYTSSFTYDSLGRFDTMTYPDSTVVSHSYASEGYLHEVKARESGAAEKIYATYTNYNAFGDIGQVSYNNGVISDYVYDVMGRLKTSKTAKGAMTFRDFGYTWNKADKLLNITDNRSTPQPNLSEAMNYDQRGRLIQANAPETYGPVAYQYDAASNLIVKGSYTYTYDSEKKHQVLTATCIPEQSQTCNERFSLQYDANGNVIRKTKSISSAFELKASVRFNVTTIFKAVATFLTGSASETGVITNEGNLYGQENWYYTYDVENRLIQVDKDVENRLIQSDEQVVFTDRYRVYTFQYGTGFNRLKKTGYDDNGAIVVETYYINDIYEIDRYPQQGNTTVCTKYIPGPEGVIAAISSDHDNCHLDNAVASATSAGQGLWGTLSQQPFSFMTMQRSAMGLGSMLLFVMVAIISRAIVQSVRGGVRRSDWQVTVTLMVIVSMIGNMVITPFSVMASEPGKSGGGLPKAGQTLYFHHNHLGSSTLITDENGAETSRVVYQPYGEIHENTGPDDFRPKFTGKELDSNSGLYYFGARYYHADFGRFLTPDPAGQFHSPYLYAAADPMAYVDPDGQFVVALTIGIIAMAAVGGAYAGGEAANHSTNPADWNWKSGKTWEFIGAGALPKGN